MQFSYVILSEKHSNRVLDFEIMNVRILVRVMSERLKQADLCEISSYLEEPEKIGATGGEIFDILTGRLLTIKKDNIPVYELIEDEAEQILRYAKQIDHL